MAESTETAKLAILIDADNAQSALTDALIAEIAKYGIASVKRVYGDWTLPNLRGWKDVLNIHAIQPIQQFRYTVGKNATDSAMIIDAMDLLYTDRFDGFVLVSSDSDFTRLASRLRESGVTVYGVGERKTPQAFVSACDKFIYVDVLRNNSQDQSRAPVRSGGNLRSDAKLVGLVRNAIDACSDEDGWAHLGGVGSHIAKQTPDFDPRNWGYRKLIDLVQAMGQFEVENQKLPDGRSRTVRLREKNRRPGAGAEEPARDSQPPRPTSQGPDRNRDRAPRDGASGGVRAPERQRDASPPDAAAAEPHAAPPEPVIVTPRENSVAARFPTPPDEPIADVPPEPQAHTEAPIATAEEQTPADAGKAPLPPQAKAPARRSSRSSGSRAKAASKKPRSENPE